MDLEQFEKLAERARADRPAARAARAAPAARAGPADVAEAVTARLRLSARGGDGRLSGRSRGLIIAIVSASSIAASILAVLGYQAVEMIEQAGASWLDPFSFWVNL